jgi:hypothetical protein
MISPSARPLPQLVPPPIQLRILGVLSDSLFRVTQVIGKSKPENEPEQSIEIAWLTEAKKAKLSNLLKTKDRV